MQDQQITAAETLEDTAAISDSTNQTIAPQTQTHLQGPLPPGVVGRPFAPGNVANPRGRPKKGQTYRERYEAAIGHELEAVAKRQVHIAKHSKDDRAAVQASSYVVDQLIGKATQRIDVEHSLADETAARLYMPGLEAEGYLEEG